jgi:NAD(P)H-dependent FMN reductase
VTVPVSSDVVLIAGSPSATSRSRSLLLRVARVLERRGWTPRLIELSTLSADGLLGRRPDPAIQNALDLVRRAGVVVVASPVYRETYSGLLKVFFDQFRPDDLKGRPAIAIATGAASAHATAVSGGLVPLLQSIGARVFASLYATDAEFVNGEPSEELRARLDQTLEGVGNPRRENGHTARPIAIYYEHPNWFEPLFAELDRRGVPYERVNAAGHRFDPAEPDRWSLVFNRMSPSAWLRGRGDAVLYTLHWLRHLETHGVRVVNGYQAFVTETSKALQLSLLDRLGLPYPAARVIHHPSQAPEAARGLRFPVVVKPNIGGSGAGVVRFDTAETLERVVAEGGLNLGPDNTGLVQEFIPAEEGRIVRVEVLDGKYLYAIRVYSAGDSYNLCPADVCQTVDGAELSRAACPVDAPKNGLRVEAYSPPPERIADVERIMAEAGIEIGGVEYIIDARDGAHYFYDINALSNFVADGNRVLGFDPFARLADWLEREAA